MLEKVRLKRPPRSWRSVPNAAPVEVLYAVSRAVVLVLVAETVRLRRERDHSALVTATVSVLVGGSSAGGGGGGGGGGGVTAAGSTNTPVMSLVCRKET